MIKIHDTLTGEKKDFLPLDPQGKKVNMYTCGVTVYDDCHIGHARSLYIFDVIRRYLKYRGYDVTLVRNITDIDDKIINRANELKVNWKELVDKYIIKYYQDLDSLGVSRADIEPRATENIPEMIVYISGLIEKGFAYATATGVYFSVRKFTEYGKLSGQSIEQMLTGVRKAADDTKEDPLDFALWKLSKPEEPGWPSPWGEGRPGWHIECSVMSQKYLKTDTLDIHAGGRDLVFPHHENEIAQAEARTGKQFAKYWIHHGLLTINEQKMSKSLGNFITIQDVLKKYPADVLKILYLQAHYRSPVDFSWEKMEEAKKAIIKLLEIFEDDLGPSTADQLSLEQKKIVDHEREITDISRKTFENVMNDDFNTPQALGLLFGMAKDCRLFLNQYQKNKTADLRAIIGYKRETIREFGAVLGLILAKRDPHDPKWASSIIKEEVKEAVDDSSIQRMIEKRLLFKKEKKFSEADTIRKELEAKGIELKDQKDGTTQWEWKR